MAPTAKATRQPAIVVTMAQRTNAWSRLASPSQRSSTPYETRTYRAIKRIVPANPVYSDRGAGFLALLGPGAGGALASFLTVSLNRSGSSSQPSSRAASLKRSDCEGWFTLVVRVILQFQLKVLRRKARRVFPTLGIEP